MKFSHTKTIPRQPKPQTFSQNEINAPIKQKLEPIKIKSTSVASLKNPIKQSSKNIFLKKGGATKKTEEEIKIENEPIKTGLFTTKPSLKYTSIKTIDPFADTTKSKMLKFLKFLNFHFFLEIHLPMFIILVEFLVKSIIILFITN